MKDKEILKKAYSRLRMWDAVSFLEWCRIINAMSVKQFQAFLEKPKKERTEIITSVLRKGKKLKPSQENLKKNFEPDWDNFCSNCMGLPIVPISGLCGPCHFGTIDAMLGNWWDPISKSINPDNIGK